MLSTMLQIVDHLAEYLQILAVLARGQPPRVEFVRAIERREHSARPREQRARVVARADGGCCAVHGSIDDMRHQKGPCRCVEGRGGSEYDT